MPRIQFPTAAESPANTAASTLPTATSRPTAPAQPSTSSAAIDGFDSSARGTRALTPSDLRAIQVAQKALASAGTIPSSNAFAAHNNKVLLGLKTQNLPTRADGVRIFVMGENTHGSEANHGVEMVRTIAGKAGLAQGADIRLYETPDDGGDDKSAIRKKTMDQIAADAPGDLLANPGYIAQLVQQAVKHTGNDGVPTLVAISVGESLNDTAESAAQACIDAPESSVLGRSAKAFLGHKATDDDYTRLLAHFQSKINTLMHEPKTAAQLAKNESALADTVQDARKHGVLTFFAAGNSSETEAPDPAGTSRDTGNAKGMIAVGVEDSAKGGVAPWSSEGAELLMPGTAVPVGPKNKRGVATTVEGSSFAGPDGAGLAALMIATGLHNVDDLERILRSPQVSRSVGGSAANAGLVPDEAAAVAASRALVRSRQPKAPLKVAA